MCREANPVFGATVKRLHARWNHLLLEHCPEVHVRITRDDQIRAGASPRFAPPPQRWPGWVPSDTAQARPAELDGPSALRIPELEPLEGGKVAVVERPHGNAQVQGQHCHGGVLEASTPAGLRAHQGTGRRKVALERYQAI